MNNLTLTTVYQNTQPIKKIYRIAKYPIVLLLNISLWLIADAQHLPFASISVPMVVGSVALLILMEQLDIHRNSWQHAASEWWTELVYFGQNALTGPIAKTAIIALLSLIGNTWQNDLAMIQQIILSLLIIDLAGYLMHRAYHEVSWLWPIHAIHHAPKKVNVFNNNIAHFLNIALGTIAQLTPVILLGFSSEAILVATTISTIHSFVIHSNSPMIFGLFDKMIMTPAHHWLHHSTVAEEAGNHATIFTFWDRLGGTYVSPKIGGPNEVGLYQGDSVPNSFFGQVLHPFLQIGKVFKQGG